MFDWFCDIFDLTIIRFSFLNESGIDLQHLRFEATLRVFYNLYGYESQKDLGLENQEFSTNFNIHFLTAQ